MADALTRIRLCAINDVDFGGALRVEMDELEAAVAVFNIEGNIYVIDDLCTHGPGSLSEGYIDGHEIECDFHNGRFDLRTGEVTAPPCMIPIRTYKVVLEGGDVLIEV